MTTIFSSAGHTQNRVYGYTTARLAHRVMPDVSRLAAVRRSRAAIRSVIADPGHGQRWPWPAHIARREPAAP
ncbi:MAG: hypothetical protein AB7I68_08510 [Porticoccaceae bacterium]